MLQWGIERDQWHEVDKRYKWYEIAQSITIYFIAGKILDDEKQISEYKIDTVKNFVVVMAVKVSCIWEKFISRKYFTFSLYQGNVA